MDSKIKRLRLFLEKFEENFRFDTQTPHGYALAFEYFQNIPTSLFPHFHNKIGQLGISLKLFQFKKFHQAFRMIIKEMFKFA